MELQCHAGSSLSKPTYLADLSEKVLTIKYFKITQESDILHIITETYLDVLAFLMKIFVFEFLPWKLLLCRYFLTTKKIKKSLYLFLWFKALEQLGHISTIKTIHN